MSLTVFTYSHIAGAKVLTQVKGTVIDVHLIDNVLQSNKDHVHKNSCCFHPRQDKISS